MIKHIIVKGKVQGVSFRYHTKKEADLNGLVGTARNLPNGDVEIYVSGEDSQLAHFEKWCRSGSPYSRVDQVVAKPLPLQREYNGFNIIY